MNVAVIGIGRIGLPVAAKIASGGHRVFGCDINAERVAMVNRGENPIPDEAGLAALLREVVAAGNLTATTDTVGAVAQCETVLFAVAVDVNEHGTADLGSLLAAAESVAKGMKRGTLCIFDTTLPVGTTRRELAPRLETDGMKLGEDFSVAFSPERLLMGRVIEDLTKYPKVVGGVDARGGERAAAFYREVFGGEVYMLANAETAELTKLSEGAYRDLNIALANELAQVADLHGIDINEVRMAANSQPYCHLHTPGTGVGGHCIPVYPRFLMQGEGPSSLSALGREVNDAMPAYAVRKVEDAIGSVRDKRVLIVDDDIRNIFALASVLESHHMQILSAETGHDAIRLLNETPDIDIVLMDIMMPEMDGIATMYELRKLPHLKNVPIIAVTAKAMKGDREKCIEAGAWDYLSKPVDTDQLLSVMRSWLYR